MELADDALQKSLLQIKFRPSIKFYKSLHSSSPFFGRIQYQREHLCGLP
jgi:hypothetical protein